MQDAWHAQLVQLFQFQANRPGIETQNKAVIDELLEVGALERLWKLVAQIHEVPMLAMCVGNHAQASQATFGRLKLQDGIQGGLFSEVKTNKPAQ